MINKLMSMIYGDSGASPGAQQPGASPMAQSGYNPCDPVMIAPQLVNQKFSLSKEASRQDMPNEERFAIKQQIQVIDEQLKQIVAQCRQANTQSQEAGPMGQSMDGGGYTPGDQTTIFDKLAANQNKIVKRW
jgi:hypothetical protein